MPELDLSDKDEQEKFMAFVRGDHLCSISFVEQAKRDVTWYKTALAQQHFMRPYVRQHRQTALAMIVQAADEAIINGHDQGLLNAYQNALSYLSKGWYRFSRLEMRLQSTLKKIKSKRVLYRKAQLETVQCERNQLFRIADQLHTAVQQKEDAIVALNAIIKRLDQQNQRLEQAIHQPSPPAIPAVPSLLL